MVPAAGPRTPVVPLASSLEWLAGCAWPLVLVGGGGRGGDTVVISPNMLKFSHLKQEWHTIFELQVEAIWPVCKHFPHLFSYSFISLW